MAYPPQSADASSKLKSEGIARLEEKINQMTGTVKQMESRWGHFSAAMIDFVNSHYNGQFLYRIKEPTHKLSCFSPSAFIVIILHSHDFFFKSFKQWETFGEAGQKPELSSREAAAAAAVAPIFLKSKYKHTIRPNIEITKLGCYLFCMKLLCCWK